MKVKVWWIFILLGLSSCKESFASSHHVKVMMEEGQSYFVSDPIQEIDKGEDVTFHVRINPDYIFDSCSYRNYQVKEEDHKLILTLLDIKYSLIVSLSLKEVKEEASFSSTEKIDDSSSSPSLPIIKEYMNYHAGLSSFLSTEEETLPIAIENHHLRENAINGYQYYQNKDGYQFDCFNTKEDNSGENVYFGSRIPYGVKDLYPVFLKETDVNDFSFEEGTNGYMITSYLADEEEVIIPSYYQGKKVVGISSGAFINKKVKSLHLSHHIKMIEPDSFKHTGLEEITFCDNLSNIFDSSFSLTPLKKVHINAIRKPVASGSYYDTFSDKVDYLDLVKDEKKIVLFSGSSTRYGYDSTLIEDAFPDYKVINMGVFAYVNVKPQLEVIKHYLHEGDILIHSPEFDSWCLDQQFAFDESFQSNLFYFFEGDYHNLEYVDISKYGDFFTQFRSYQGQRNLMPNKDYSIQAKHYDDDGNYYEEETYNIQGDFILYRENNPTDERLMQPLTPYTVSTFRDELFTSINQIYDELSNIGVDCYFTYAPKNIRALSMDSTLSEINQVDSLFKEKISVPILGNIHDSLYPGTCFYLIDNHLSTEYAIVRTNKVIENLQTFLT